MIGSCARIFIINIWLFGSLKSVVAVAPNCPAPTTFDQLIGRLTEVGPLNYADTNCGKLCMARQEYRGGKHRTTEKGRRRANDIAEVDGCNCEPNDSKFAKRFVEWDRAASVEFTPTESCMILCKETAKKPSWWGRRLLPRRASRSKFARGAYRCCDRDEDGCLAGAKCVCFDTRHVPRVDKYVTIDDDTIRQHYGIRDNKYVQLSTSHKEAIKELFCREHECGGGIKAIGYYGDGRCTCYRREMMLTNGVTSKEIDYRRQKYEIGFVVEQTEDNYNCDILCKAKLPYASGVYSEHASQSFVGPGCRCILMSGTKFKAFTWRRITKLRLTPTEECTVICKGIDGEAFDRGGYLNTTTTTTTTTTTVDDGMPGEAECHCYASDYESRLPKGAHQTKFDNVEKPDVDIYNSDDDDDDDDYDDDDERKEAGRHEAMTRLIGPVDVDVQCGNECATYSPPEVGILFRITTCRCYPARKRPDKRIVPYYSVSSKLHTSVPKIIHDGFVLTKDRHADATSAPVLLKSDANCQILCSIWPRYVSGTNVPRSAVFDDPAQVGGCRCETIDAGVDGFIDWTDQILATIQLTPTQECTSLCQRGVGEHPSLFSPDFVYGGFHQVTRHGRAGEPFCYCFTDADRWTAPRDFVAPRPGLSDVFTDESCGRACGITDVGVLHFHQAPHQAEDASYTCRCYERSNGVSNRISYESVSSTLQFETSDSGEPGNSGYAGEP